MTNLALKIPGFNQPINPPEELVKVFPSQSLGEVLTAVFDLILLIAGVLMFYWMIWGIFHYIFAGGDKEGLSKARARITWAIVGFIIIVISFAVQGYVKNIFPPFKGEPKVIMTVTEPK
ncbi:MAG: hypothetical protein Q7R43_03340 [Candidatus Daviesbacteria bacterium]|nr:hypothetical protein [Candidatus Daviesbacteria bacterium]